MADEPTDLPKKKEYLKKQTCFSNIADEEMEVLATLLKEVTFPKDEVIVKEGEHVDSVYIIISGTADVMHTVRENGTATEEKVAELKDGDAIGLSDQGFYSLTGLRTATVTATSELVTFKLGVAIFRGFALAYPKANAVMREQASRF